MTAPTVEIVLAIAAKTARDRFKEHGEIRPMWCGHTAANEMVIVIPESFGNAKDKQEKVNAVRTIFKERGVVVFSYMIEAWLLKVTPGRSSPATLAWDRRSSLEHHPDRREAIQIGAEDRERHLTGHYFILRPEHGKPTLSPFHKHAPGKTVGRMTKLLRDDYEPGAVPGDVKW